MLFARLQSSPVGGSTLTTSAPKSDRITAALGPAMKLDRSTTFSPEKMLSAPIDVLCGRRRPVCFRKVWATLFEERRERLPRIGRPDAGGELLRLGSHGLLELRAYRSRDEALARLQRAGRFFGQPLRDLVRRGQNPLIGDDPRHESERCGLRGVERLSEQNEVGRADVS